MIIGLEKGMAALSPDRAAELLSQTKERASTFIEDSERIRHILKLESITAGDIKLLSSILRRQLVDDDLAKVAAPRIGKLLLDGPDNKPFYRVSEKKPYLLFVSGGNVALYGLIIRASAIESGNDMTAVPDFDPERRVAMRVDAFMAQPVLCMNGQWLTRRDAIKYVANVAGGVHSGAAISDEEVILSHIRRCGRYEVVDGNFRLNFDAARLTSSPVGPPPTFNYAPTSIDVVLFEVLAAAHFLVESPSFAKLERVVRLEFGLPQT